MKTRKLLRDLLRELRNLRLGFSVRQNRHIKVEVTNPVTAQTAMLIVAVSPSCHRYEDLFWRQYETSLNRLGVIWEPTKKKGETK